MAAASDSFLPELPLEAWAERAVDWLTATFPGFFRGVKDGLGFFVDRLELVLTGPPEPVVIAVLALLAGLAAGWRVGFFALLASLLIASLGLWPEAMLTLALVVASTAVALALGVPLGILAARVRPVRAVSLPLLDVMQTMPAFVYLIPMVLLLGLGNVPALIATVVFAMPPAVRLTVLGLDGVPRDAVEAAEAFGATPWQTLVKVQLPLALPTLMAGVNQVIMLSLSMVVVAALIGAGGLGAVVVGGLSQMNVGRGFVGGVAIVLIAMVLDRATRDVGRRPGADGAGRRPDLLARLLPRRADPAGKEVERPEPAVV